MKHGSNEKDIEYAQLAAKAISNDFDTASLSSLSEFIPSIHNLIDGISKNTENSHSQFRGDLSSSQWEFIFLVSKLLGSILRLDRFVMFCVDDLQWCDASMLVLLEETIFSVAQHKQERQHLLFVGTYRNNEVDNGHPLTKQLINLQRNKQVNVTEINLSRLSIPDIEVMCMTEMRLPRRLVVDLASVTYKKTRGHTIYVIELLNSMLRDSTISFSPHAQRFVWDQDGIKQLPAIDGVAGLVASNVSSLPVKKYWKYCHVSVQK
jgi:predicted ATPase